MAWERRRNGVFFYKNVRMPDGRRSKEYYGRGLEAQVVALEVDRRKLARLQLLKAKREWKNHLAEAELISTEFHVGLSESLTAKMVASGFHNPLFRGWRRKKMEPEELGGSISVCEDYPVDLEPKVREDNRTGQDSSRSGRGSIPAREFESAAIANEPAKRKGRTLGRAKIPPVCPAEAPAESQDPLETSTQEQKSVEEMDLDELRQAASCGNRAAMSRLRPIMDQNAEHYARLSCLSAKAKYKWIEAHCGHDLFQRDCLRRSITDLAAGLLKDGDSAMERLLADEVVLCFLRSRYWIARETQGVGSDFNALVATFTVEQSAKSQKQLLKAINNLRDFRVTVVRRSFRASAKVVQDTALSDAV